MKAKILIAVSVVALLVAAMSVGIYARRVTSDYDYLDSSLGRIKITGNLFAVSGDHDFAASTISEQDISSQGVQRIAARVIGSPEKFVDTTGENSVLAFGDVEASSHTAESSIDDVYIYLPN